MVRHAIIEQDGLTLDKYLRGINEFDGALLFVDEADIDVDTRD